MWTMITENMSQMKRVQKKKEKGANCSQAQMTLSRVKRLLKVDTARKRANTDGKECSHKLRWRPEKRKWENEKEMDEL